MLARKNCATRSAASVSDRSAVLTISVGQCPKKSDNVPDILRTQGSRGAGLAVEGPIGRIHIGAIPRRQIVIFDNSAVRGSRIEPRRLDVSLGIPFEHFIQRVKHPIVEKHLAGGDIAAEKREVPNAPQAVKIVAQLDAAVAIMSKISLTPEVVELKSGKDVVQPLILVTMGDPTPDVAKVIAAAKAASGG